MMALQISGEMIWDFGAKYAPKVVPDQGYNVDLNANDSNEQGASEPSANYCKVAFKMAIVLLSFAGFLYQATDICAHYFSYRTVVYTHTEQESVIDLPAVTFCLPTYFTKERLKDLYGTHIEESLDEAKRYNNTLVNAIEPIVYESFQVNVNFMR